MAQIRACVLGCALSWWSSSLLVGAVLPGEDSQYPYFDMAFPNGDQDQPFSYAKLSNKPFPVPSHLGPSSYNTLAQAPIVQSQAPQLVWDDFDTSLPNGGTAASNRVNDNDSLVGYSTLVQQLLTQPEHITSPGTGGEYNAPPFDQGTTALLPQTSGSQTPYNPGPLPRFPITRLKPRAGTVSSVQSDSIVPNSIIDQAIKAYIAATPGATASFPLEQLESYFVEYRFTPSQLPAQYLAPNKKNTTKSSAFGISRILD